MSAQILLDPVDFMALQLSSLVHGGIGGWKSFSSPGVPHCIRGHAQWLDGSSGMADQGSYMPVYGPDTPMTGRMPQTISGLSDDHIGETEPRVPFEEYIKRLNIDIKEVA